MFEPIKLEKPIKLVGSDDSHPLFSPDLFHNVDEDIDEDDDDDDDDDDINEGDVSENDKHDKNNDDDIVERSCQDTEFQCKSDHFCIPLDLYCDGFYNCADYSDEANCATTPRIPYSNRTDAPQTTGDEFKMFFVHILINNKTNSNYSKEIIHNSILVFLNISFHFVLFCCCFYYFLFFI